MPLAEQTNALEKIETSFKRYRSFKDGWADGGGEGTSPELIDCLIDLCRKFYPADLPSPLIFPMIDGGFDFYWRLENIEVSLSIEEGPSLAEIIIFDTAKLRRLNADKTVKRIGTDECFTSIKADITTPEGWDTLNKTVSKILKTKKPIS